MTAFLARVSLGSSVAVTSLLVNRSSMAWPENPASSATGPSPGFVIVLVTGQTDESAKSSANFLYLAANRLNISGVISAIYPGVIPVSNSTTPSPTSASGGGGAAAASDSTTTGIVTCAVGVLMSVGAVAAVVYMVRYKRVDDDGDGDASAKVLELDDSQELSPMMPGATSINMSSAPPNKLSTLSVPLVSKKLTPEDEDML